MNTQKMLLCILLCISLCACQKPVSENESIVKENGQSVLQKEELLKVDENEAEIEPVVNEILEKVKVCIDKYNDFAMKEKVKRMALIYLDGDNMPELLMLKNGEYRLYSFDGIEVKEISLPNAEIKANAYGLKHDVEESEYQTFYWFEYVPYRGLIRVHGDVVGERHDYYLKYTSGMLVKELEIRSVNYEWYTYDAEKEISNEEFLNQLSNLGYDSLVPCDYLYKDAVSAYENIGRISDTQKLLDDFVNGKIDALYYVKEIADIPADGFVMRSYDEFFEDLTAGDEVWGRQEYIDFDNDGEDELILHGYAGACVFFDVIGDTVYTLLRTGGTADMASIAEIQEKKVIVRTDLLHAGRKDYRIMMYDACCCPVDWFRLYAEYEGTDYTENGMFRYRNREISMAEFEAVLRNIQ